MNSGSFLSDSFLDGPLPDSLGVPWMRNIINGVTTTKRISRIMKLEHFLAWYDTQASYFMRPSEWEDQNDAIILRTNLYDESHPEESYQLGWQNQYFAQCWCAKESESWAMWNVFTKDKNNYVNPDGYVMVTSTVDKVMSSLWNSTDVEGHRIYCGDVKYVPIYNLIDEKFFANQSDGIFDNNGSEIVRLMLFKSDEYNFEHEVRFIIQSKASEGLLNVTIQQTYKTQNIIDGIILHPKSSDAYLSNVRQALSDRKSSLRADRSKLFTQKPTKYAIPDQF